MRAMETTILKFKDMKITVTSPTKDGFKARTWTELLAYKRAKAETKKGRFAKKNLSNVPREKKK